MTSCRFCVQSETKYGPQEAPFAGAPMPSGLTGVSVLMAPKNGIVIRARKSGATFDSLIVNLLPLALTPEAVCALPSSTAFAPATSSRNVVAGELIFGCRSRLIAYAKFAAVTFVPSANLMPDRTVNEYVFPSFEIAGSDLAASGTIREPPAFASLSGKPSSLHWVASSTCQECEKYASAASEAKGLCGIGSFPSGSETGPAGLRGNIPRPAKTAALPILLGAMFT